MSMLSRFATLGGLPSDPYWTSVSYLLVGNGANNTTTNIVDSSSNNVTTTRVGSPVISTAISPPAITNAGSGTVYFPGSTAYLSLPMSSLFQVGAGQFTIEFWIYVSSIVSLTSVAGNFNIVAYPGNCNGWDIIFNGSSMVFRWGSPSYNDTGTATIPTGQWNHVAVVNTGSQIKMYVNGAQGGTPSSNNIITNFSLSNLFVGFGGSSSGLSIPPFTGYLYDFRITKGVCRYTANYTPPPFPPTSAMPTQ